MTVKGENQLEWICRILVTFDFLLILSGYLFYIQTRRQLISPPIPKSLTDQILNDSYVVETCLIAAIPFLAGLWFYFFKKKITAIVFLSLTILISKVLPLVL